MRKYGLRFLLLAIATVTAPTYADSLRVAVASNFAPVLESLLDKEPPPLEVSIISGATGALTSQILMGAPFDVLLAADAERPAKLAQLQAIAKPVCYAQGQLVLSGATAIDDIKTGGRIAIANPLTAPYGRAAIEVLTRLNEPSLQVIQGNNAQQAFQFKASGNVDFALIPASLGDGLAIPDDWYRPIEQYGMSVRAANHPNHTDAQVFLLWLMSEQVQSHLNDYGYSRCQHDP